MCVSRQARSTGDGLTRQLPAAHAAGTRSAAEACDRFDAANTGATVPRREAARLVSCSQAGAGAFLMRLPDVSVKDSTIDSTDFRTIVQRRLGLYLTCLAVLLDESEARGAVVTQHKRLGDAAINAANTTHRHNEGMNAVYVALRSASTATSPGRRREALTGKRWRDREGSNTRRYG